jgi:hypothetical protein
MAHTTFALDPTHPADPQVGFDIGWDHARHGLPPPPEQWLEGNPLHQGWRAGRACFGERILGASPRVRLWLALRLHAWLRNRAFELAELTPHYLGQIGALQCPITRQTLGQADSSVDRVNDQAGYAAGNLATMSVQANRAKASRSWDEALAQARRAEGSAGGRIDGLDADAWARVAVLVSFVTPLLHEQAARLPLRVLPPNRLRVLNPVQGLQALVTRELGRPDGTRRLRELAALLPAEPMRLDFHRLLSAMLPRRIEAGRDADARSLRHALEDAWCDARVNRCWQRFALQLDAALIEQLLQRCAAGALAGTRVLLHEPARATEGWALERGGWALPAGPSGQRVLRRPAPRLAADRARIAASCARTADGHLPA